MLKQKAEAILRHFTVRITNTELRLQINNTYGHDGVAFIIATEQRLNMTNSVRNSSATARYAMLLDHRKTGLTRVSTETWTMFLNLDHAHNDALTGTTKFSDNNALSHAYHQVLRACSVDVHTRVVAEMDRLQTE